MKNVLNTEFIKFHNYLMEGSRIDLKTFLDLAKPNNIPKVPESKYQAGFGVIISGQNPQTFMIPIYSTTVLYYDTLFTFDIFKWCFKHCINFTMAGLWYT